VKTYKKENFRKRPTRFFFTRTNYIRALSFKGPKVKNMDK